MTYGSSCKYKLKNISKKSSKDMQFHKIADSAIGLSTAGNAHLKKNLSQWGKLRAKGKLYQKIVINGDIWLRL